MARASDRLTDKDAHAASAQLFDRGRASSRLAAGHTARMSSQPERSASARLKPKGQPAADARTARAEKKLSRRDRNEISKKYAQRAGAISLLAARAAAEASEDREADGCCIPGTVPSPGTGGAPGHTGTASPGTGGAPPHRPPAASPGAAGAPPARTASARAAAQRASGRRPRPGTAAQRAAERHAGRPLASLSKERATEIARRSAARGYAVQRAAAKPAGGTLASRISGVLFPGTGKGAALRQGARRGAALAAGAAFAAVPLVFGGLLLLIILSGASAAGGGWNMEGLSDSERAVASYLKGKGLEKVAVAAVLGNMRQESGVDPAMHQADGPGRGLLQWEAGSSRFEALCALAEARGMTWEDIGVQLDFFWAEVPAQFEDYSSMDHTYPSGAQAGLGRYMPFSEWCGIGDLPWATESFERVYTRASMPMMDRRIAYAARYLALLGRSPGAGDAESVIGTALTKLGAPYIFGAAGPDAFDCSGFVKWCFEQNGIEVPARTAEQIYRIASPVAAADARAGDIVVFTYGSPQLGETYGHIGIYLGDGLMIETSSPLVGVNVCPTGDVGTYGRL